MIDVIPQAPLPPAVFALPLDNSDFIEIFEEQGLLNQIAANQSPISPDDLQVYVKDTKENWRRFRLSLDEAVKAVIISRDFQRFKDKLQKVGPLDDVVIDTQGKVRFKIAEILAAAESTFPSLPEHLYAVINTSRVEIDAVFGIGKEVSAFLEMGDYLDAWSAPSTITFRRKIRQEQDEMNLKKLAIALAFARWKEQIIRKMQNRNLNTEETAALQRRLPAQGSVEYIPFEELPSRLSVFEQLYERRPRTELRSIHDDLEQAQLTKNAAARKKFEEELKLALAIRRYRVLWQKQKRGLRTRKPITERELTELRQMSISEPGTALPKLSLEGFIREFEAFGELRSDRFYYEALKKLKAYTSPDSRKIAKLELGYRLADKRRNMRDRARKGISHSGELEWLQDYDAQWYRKHFPPA